MKKIRTHYDNLKVARDAPEFIIRAAYKSLSQKYHPDKSGVGSESGKIMSIINNSYQILSDPIQRKSHDEWILRMESHSDASKQCESISTSNVIKVSLRASWGVCCQIGRLSCSVVNNFLAMFFALLRVVVHFCVVGGVVALAVFFLSQIYGNSHSGKPEVSQFPSAKPTYERPVHAPNGEPWPARASYLDGYGKGRTNGISTITVDNSDNGSDVFVKLIAFEDGVDLPVRWFYIPAYQRFLVDQVGPGAYEIRYRDLSTGSYVKSQRFDVEQIENSYNTQYGQISITLYKVSDGNFHTYPISESDF